MPYSVSNTHWLTYWQNLKDRATKLLRSRSGPLVTQCSEAKILTSQASSSGLWHHLWWKVVTRVMPVCPPQARRWRCHIKDQTNKQNTPKIWKGLKAKNTNEIQMQIHKWFTDGDHEAGESEANQWFRQSRPLPLIGAHHYHSQLSIGSEKQQWQSPRQRQMQNIRRHQIHKQWKQTQCSDNFLSSSNFHSSVSIW